MSTSLLYKDGREVPVELGYYPDGTPVKSLHDYDFSNLAGVIHRYSNYTEFVGAMTMVRALSFRNYLKLFIPYLPGARQDKPRPLDEEGDALPSMAMAIDIIALSGASKVYFLDVHSQESVAYGNAVYGETPRRDMHFENLSPDMHFENLSPLTDSLIKGICDFYGYDGIIAPDAGARQRASDFAIESGLPLLMGTKRRDPATNKLSDYSIKGIVPGGHYLVVDDICDSGGTFNLIGQIAQQSDATLDLFVTHGLFTKGALRRLGHHYRNVFTLDTLDFPDRPKTTIKTVTEIAKDAFAK